MARLIACVILLAGVLVRLPHLGDPPLDFHPTRQYRSTIIARGYVLDRLPHLSDRERIAAQAAARQQAAIEPPIVERLAALAYRLAGREDLRLARSISVLAWLIGAIALFWVARQLFRGTAAPIAALSIFLFIPFSVTASQAFQPDALMTAAIVVAVAAVILHDARASVPGFIGAICAAAAAIFIKPMAALFVLPVFLVLAIRRNGWLRGTLLALGFAVITTAATAAWYITSASDAAEGRFYPELLRTPAFWRGWLQMVDKVTWLPLAAASLAGAALAGVRSRWIILALWSGYLMLGVLFAHHISTHDYYSLPLIPIVGLGIGALVEFVDVRLKSRRPRIVALCAGAALVAAALGVCVRSTVLRSSDEIRTQAADYARIGQLVDHSRSVASLDGSYAFPLNYHGLMFARNWPLSIDRAVSRLSGRSNPTGLQLLSRSNAQFFVATLQSELEAEPELARALEERFSLLERGGSIERWRYKVFDLRQRKTMSTTPQRISLFALTDGLAASDARVTLTAPAGTTWHTETSPTRFVRVEPDHGVGSSTLTLVPLPTPSEVDQLLEVLIFAAGTQTPITRLVVRFRSMGTRPGSPPLGAVDSPSTAPIAADAGSVTFQGWALDAFDFRRVVIEATDSTGRTIVAGETRGTSMRNDIARLFPIFHDVFHSGWEFTLEPSKLSTLAAPITLHFYAEGGDGRRTEIGQRVIRSEK